MSDRNKGKSAGQRQLRVGEELRHALSEIFLFELVHQPGISGLSITVAEVRVSPDLRNATAFICPLGGNAPAGFIESVNAIAPQLNYMVAQKVKMRFAPRIIFRIDDSFEKANKIETLIQSVKKNSPSSKSDD